jgi:hypothetical protein
VPFRGVARVTPLWLLPDLAEGLLTVNPHVALALEEVVPQHPLLGGRREAGGRQPNPKRTTCAGVREALRANVTGPFYRGQTAYGMCGIAQPEVWSTQSPTLPWQERETEAQGGARTGPEPRRPLTASSCPWSWAVSFHVPSGTVPIATWLRPSSV